MGAGSGVYLTESVYKVVLQKSIPAQICQLVPYTINDEGYVDGFVRKLLFLKNTFCEQRVCAY